jgi:hypothetical protein
MNAVPKGISQGKLFPIFNDEPEPDIILSPTFKSFGCNI